MMNKPKTKEEYIQNFHDAAQKSSAEGALALVVFAASLTNSSVSFHDAFFIAVGNCVKKDGNGFTIPDHPQKFPKESAAIRLATNTLGFNLN